MKIIDAISELDIRKPNSYTIDEKKRWLSRLDLRIKNNILDTHEDETEAQKAFSGYGENDDVDTELLIGEPYAEIYILWMSAQIDLCNNDIDLFNNANAVFESVFSDFADSYNRAHMPLGHTKKYF